MTAWNAWLHPRRTSRVVNEERQRADNAIAQSASLKEEMDALRTRLSEAEVAKEEAEKYAAESALSVETLGAELIKVRQELDEEREITAKIAELEKQFEQVMEMKEHYESRIKRLKTALADARATIKKLSGESVAVEEIAPIDMTKPEPERNIPSATSAPTQQKDKNTAKRQVPAVTPSLFSTDDAIHSKGATHSESTEWLMSLPDDLPFSNV